LPGSAPLIAASRQDAIRWIVGFPRSVFGNPAFSSGGSRSPPRIGWPTSALLPAQRAHLVTRISASPGDRRASGREIVDMVPLIGDRRVLSSRRRVKAERPQPARPNDREVPRHAASAQGRARHGRRLRGLRPHGCRRLRRPEGGRAQRPPRPCRRRVRRLQPGGHARLLELRGWWSGLARWPPAARQGRRPPRRTRPDHPRMGIRGRTRRIPQPTRKARIQAVGSRRSRRPRIQAVAPYPSA